MKKQIERMLVFNLYALIGSFVIRCCRFFLNRFVFVRIGLWFDLKGVKTKTAPLNPVLELAYSKSKKWTPEQILGLSKQLDISQAEVEQWLYLKSSENKLTVLKKFIESSWRFCYYTFQFLFGLVVLLDKHWLWDISECWTDLHNQIVTNDVWWYIMLCASFSWSQLLGLLYDVKKKDFFAMVIHHLSMIFLGNITLMRNMFRMGAVTMLISDAPDIFLEASKMANYLGGDKCAFFLFSLFTVMWFTVRFGLQPFWLTRSFFVDVPKVVPPLISDFTYYTIGALISLMLVLNCIWSYFVIKTMVQILTTGNRRDERSDSEND